jgi:hypothetical protein
MQLILHTGAHFTEDDRLTKCLLRNRDDFAKRGVSVPGPSTYRRLMRDTLNALDGVSPSPEAREVLLDAMVDDDTADRLILSNPHLFGAPRAAIQQGRLYPKAVEKLLAISRLFPQDEIEMFMAIRNPATFLPTAFKQSPKPDIDRFIGNVPPQNIRWSELFQRIREEIPRVSVTAWCSEDSPLIWAQIIREMAGLEHGEKIIGGFDLLSSIMSRAGMKRFRAYLKEHPTMNEIQKRRVIAAFLDKFAIEDEIEEELDLPGWTMNLVDEVTEAYDEDVFEIQRIPGVNLIMP